MKLVKRYILYPVIIGFITLKLMETVLLFDIGESMLNHGPIATVEGMLGIALPYEIIKYYFAYAVGFTYGTGSLIFPIHKMGLGIIGFVLMYLKYWISFTFISAYTMLWIPIEILILVIYYITRIANRSVKKNGANDNGSTNFNESHSGNENTLKYVRI